MKKHETSAARWRWPILCVLILMRGLPAIGGANPPFVIAGTALGEMAANAAFDGTNFLVGIQGNELSPQGLSVQLVSQTGTLLSRANLNVDGGAPSMGFGGGRFIVVGGEATLYGQIVDSAGALVGAAFPICANSPSYEPARAIPFDGTNFLVCWEDRRSGRDIYGQLVSPAGELVGSEIAIATNAAREGEPAVAFDGANFLVVFSTDVRTSSGYAEDVHGQFVAPSGALVGANFVIDQNDFPSDNPVAIAFDGAKYAVLFHDQMTNRTPADWDIYARFVWPSGDVGTDRFAIAASTDEDEHYPGIAFDGSHFLVTVAVGLSDEGFAANASVRGRFFDTNLNAVTPWFTVMDAPGANEFPLVGWPHYGSGQYLCVVTTVDSDFESIDVYGVFVAWEDPAADFTYVTNNGAITITGYTGAGGHVAIPGTIDGLLVTGIGDSAFSGKSGITSVSIPASVSSIGVQAFVYCPDLASIEVAVGNPVYSSLDGVLFDAARRTLVRYPEGRAGAYAVPEGVENIADKAFYYCRFNLTGVVLPASVVSIGGEAFAMCFALAEANLSTNVASIGQGAFFMCDSLTNLTIPGSATNIGDGAFMFCSSLQEIILPEGLASIGFQMFHSCSSLTNVVIPASVTSIGQGAFSWCSALSGVELPAGLTSIGDSAFSYCVALTTIAIPDGVAYIGNEAFAWCSTLSSVIIPGSVSSIGNAAFYQCHALSSVVLSNGISSIGTAAFASCGSLAAITIPATVSSIGQGAFSQCIGLKSIVVDGDNPTFSSDGGVLFDKSQSELILCPEGKAGGYAIPSGVETIRNNAFANCTLLTDVEIPDSVTVLGMSAFSGCISLTNAVIGSGIAHIGNSAFSSCSSLASIEVPGTVHSIGDGAFFYCTALAKVVIGSGVSHIGSYAFYGCAALTELDLPGSVVFIGDQAFYGCASLVSVVLPASLATLGNNAFAYCAALEGVYFCGNAPAVVGVEPFYCASDAMIVYYLAGTTGWESTFGGRPTALWTFDLSSDSGPYAGGNTVTITIGNLGTVTNVLVGGVVATIVDSGDNWVTITIPALGSAGVKDIVLQTSDHGDITLAGAYTVNPAGVIGSDPQGAVSAGGEHSLGLKSDGSIVAWGRHDYSQTAVPSPNSEFVALAAGYYHSLGLKSDGSIVGWGWNEYGQTAVPSPNSDFVAVSAGGHHSLSLKTDGSIVAWGWNEYGQTNVPAPNAAFVAVAGGGHHSLGLKSDGSIVAWGDNFQGQTNVPLPNADFVAVSAGGHHHSLGLKSDGSIVAWGWNYYGQTAVPSPNADFVAVAGGGRHSLGLKSDGSIVAWGHNLYGQTAVPSPNTDFVAVSAGDYHSLGLKSDGSIVAWGGNDYGQTVVPSLNADFGLPAGVQPESGSWTGGYEVVISGSNLGNGSDVTNVTLCGVSAAIVSQSSKQIVVTAGAGLPGTGDVAVYSTSYGVTTKTAGFTYEKTDQTIAFPAIGHQLTTDTVGLSATASSGLPVSFSVLEGPASISDDTNLAFTGVGTVSVVASQAGDAYWNAAPDVTNTFHVYEISSDSGPYAGGNTLTITNGNLGAVTNVLVGGVAATIMDAGETWVTLTIPALGSAGAKDIVIQTSDHGDITLAGAYTVNPAGVVGFDQPVAIAAGAYHSLGLKSDGSIVAWGSNVYGQTNVPSPNTDFVAVAGGRDYSLGLKADGSIVAWGRNYEGQTDVPSPNTGFVAIAAGGYHSLGLKSDGSIVAWGRSDSGQTAVPSPNTDFVAVAAGESHSLGLKSDGGIVAWGSSYEGQTAVPSPNSDFVAVAAGNYHSLGLKSDGSIVAWGWNGSGQTAVPSPNSDFVAVTAGNYHSLGLKSDSSIVAWGDNNSGQKAVPSPNSDFVALASGDLHSLGLKSDGSIVAWGYNDSGEASVPSPNSDFGYSGGVQPKSGLWTGGYEVVISGSNLGNGSDITNVTICGVSAAIVSQSSTQIVVTAGEGLPGTGDVAVYSTSYGVTTKTAGFTYLKTDQTIAFPAISVQLVTDTVGLSATASSGLPVSFSVLEGPAVISDGTNLAFTGAGTVSVVASQAGDAYWNAAPDVTNTFNVVQGAPVIELSGNLAFGNVTTGATATATLTITNSGDATLTVTGITYPDGFSGAWSGTIAAGHATNVTVTFAPVEVTTYSGTVTVHSDATSGTNTISASGTGAAASAYEKAITGFGLTTANSGTLVNGPSWVPGRYGNGLSLANGQYVSVPAPSPDLFNITGDLTLALWIKPNSVTCTGADPGYALISKRSSNRSTPYELFIANGGTLVLHYYGTDIQWPNFRSSGTVSVGLWQHVVVTRSFSGGNATVRFYINGVEAGSSTAATGPALGSPDPVWISRDGYNTVYTDQGSYSGLMDEVQIYGRSLSEAEIAKLYSNDDRCMAGRVGNWRFDETTGTTASDTLAVGVINEQHKMVTAVVPDGTDVTAQIAWIEISVGATVDPPSGSMQDFSSPVLYTVTAEDLSKQGYSAAVIACNSLIDRDGNGLPDALEVLKFGATGLDPSAICANGRNTLMDAYIAGFDPTDPDAGFRVTGIDEGGRILQWQAVPGRIYSVYWSTNLLDGFQLLVSEYPGSAITNTGHSAESRCFYKIGVQLEP